MPSKAFVDTYCVTCHNQRLKTAGLAIDTLDVTNVAADSPAWEKVVVKLRAGLMPPAGMPRPQPAAIETFTSALETALDRAADAHPDPGRTETFHRLNRAEYQNAIRDLLALDVNLTTLLPADEISYGFDNIAGVLKLSPLLIERYLGAARRCRASRWGLRARPTATSTACPTSSIRMCASRACRWGRAAAPASTTSLPRDGEYVIKARLGRGVDYDVPHFLGAQQLEISVDGAAGAGVHPAGDPGGAAESRARRWIKGGRRRRSTGRRAPRCRPREISTPTGWSRFRSRPACTRFARPSR